MGGASKKPISTVEKRLKKNKRRPRRRRRRRPLLRPGKKS